MIRNMIRGGSGETGSVLETEYGEKIKSNNDFLEKIDLSKLSKNEQDKVKSIIESIKKINNNASAMIEYLKSIEGSIPQFDLKNSKLEEYNAEITKTKEDITKQASAFKSLSKEDIEKLINTLNELSKIYQSFLTSDKVGFFIGNFLVNQQDKDNVSKQFSEIKTSFDEMVASISKDANDANDAKDAIDSSSDESANVVVSANAIRFMIEGEIDKTNKQINKITSITLGDCKFVSDEISITNGTINQTSELTDKIAKCIDNASSSKTSSSSETSSLSKTPSSSTLTQGGKIHKRRQATAHKKRRTYKRKSKKKIIQIIP